MKNRKKTIKLCIVVLLALFTIILIGPADFFTHGFFSDDIPYEDMTEEDVDRIVDLEQETYIGTFVPQKDYFAGFEILITNNPLENNGLLYLTVSDESGKKLEEIEIDIFKVVENTWYIVQTDAQIDMGEKYTLEIRAKDCDTYPQLLIVNDYFLSGENASGNLLIKYAYEKSTFSSVERVMICLFVVVLALWLSAVIIAEDKYSKNMKKIAFFVFLVCILVWNYMFNTMDNKNTSFEDFQVGSETLVTGPIMAERLRIWNHNDYGLGRFYDIYGTHNSYDLEFLTNENWNNGYSRTDSAIVLNTSALSTQIVKEGNSVEFKDGSIYEIIEVNEGQYYTWVYFDTEEILSEKNNGSLSQAVFIDAEGNVCDSVMLSTYVSQYGLQGKVFRVLSRFMDEENAIENLNLLCSILTAIVFVLIVYVIYKKYNFLMAVCFFATFWLSPWIVNFARNLYWVQFTWFLPMLIGLICAWKIDNKKCRMVCYIATFVSILGKCLCGYEYIAVVMMGLIVFLLVDMILAMADKNKEKSKLLFRTIFIIGLIAVAAFMTAICIHATMRKGNIFEGIIDIFENDVLRRTVGADYNEYSEVLRASFNASAWETFCMYFHFPTEILVGVGKNLFPLIAVAPLAIFGYEYANKKLNIELVAMYLLFFCTSVCWFVLAKGHSFNHPHMNYVLWYFGFVQICLYIIFNKIREYFGKDKKLQSEGE